MFSGEIIGTYRLEHEVARGGMGAVWRAIDQRTGQPVAIKVLIESDPSLLERFFREAEMLGTLEHPNIVRYIAHGTTDVGPYLAMEWLDAEPLTALLTGLSIAESVAVCRDVANGLHAAHSVGVIHRDVKPSNILVPRGSSGSVRLIDFGIARSSRRTSDLTRTGLLVGTPGYAAPEQIRKSQDVDHRCDVFALGCVLYAAVTKRPAFLAADLRATLIRTLHADATPVRELAPDAPDALVWLIERMMRRNPALRPPTAAAVAEELGGLRDLPTAAPGPAPSANEVATVPFAVPPVAAMVIGWDDDEPETAAWASPAVADERARRVRAVGAANGVELDELCDGAFVATVRVDGPATLARLARCARSIAGAEPLARIAVVTTAPDGNGDPVERACTEVAAATLAAAIAPPPRGIVRVDRAVADVDGGARPVPRVTGMFDLDVETGT
jgi:hypothetical protein